MRGGLDAAHIRLGSSPERIDLRRHVGPRAPPATGGEVWPRLTPAPARPRGDLIFGDTSPPAPPPFRVTCTFPSAVPAQITFAFSGDSEIIEIANHGIPPGTPPSDSGKI